MLPYFLILNVQLFIYTMLTMIYHINQMENIQGTQQSQKNIDHNNQRLYPRLSTRDQQEVYEGIEQNVQVVNVMKHITIQQTHSVIINKHNLDQNIGYCRICLQGEMSQAKLLSPCKCSNCIHDKCLLDWLHHKQLINNQSAMKCQVCLSTYSIDLIQKYCFTFQVCKKQNQKFIPSFALQFLIFLALFSATGYSVVFLININSSEDFASQVSQLLDLPKNTLIVLGFIGFLFSCVLTLCLGWRILHNFCYGVEISLIEQNRQ